MPLGRRESESSSVAEAVTAPDTISPHGAGGMAKLRSTEKNAAARTTAAVKTADRMLGSITEAWMEPCPANA